MVNASKRGPNPPESLTPESKALWRKLNADYELAAHDLERLRCGLEARDRMNEAKAILDASGLTYDDRWGAPRARPEVSIERDSRLAYIRCLRELGLDLEDASEGPRPPGLYR